MDISGYLSEIRSLAASGQATEHSYRPALDRLFKSIRNGINCLQRLDGTDLLFYELEHAKNVLMGVGTE